MTQRDTVRVLGGTGKTGRRVVERLAARNIDVRAVSRSSTLPFEEFMQRHRQALAEKPFAAFLVCMALAKPSARTQQAAEAWLQPIRALVNPVSEGYFAGVLNLRTVPPVYRLFFRVAVILRATVALLRRNRLAATRAYRHADRLSLL